MLRAFFFRSIDIGGAVVGLAVLCPLLIIFSLTGFLVYGKPIYSQVRVGRNKRPFRIYKFRSIVGVEKPCATHELDPQRIGRYGNFLRVSKIDEIPQLFNIVSGSMAFVGARPCLPIQRELIAIRAKFSIYDHRPGITGLAQLRGVGMDQPDLLVMLEREMFDNLTVGRYFHYIILTIFGGGRGDRVGR